MWPKTRYGRASSVLLHDLGENTCLVRLWRSNKKTLRMHLAQLPRAEQGLSAQWVAGGVTVRRLLTKALSPTELSWDGLCQTPVITTHIWDSFWKWPWENKKNVFLPVNEAPLERPRPSPFLRSMSLEFGNSLECWAPAGEQSCRISQPRVPGIGKQTLWGKGRML